jgi:hypothetical protein
MTRVLAIHGIGAYRQGPVEIVAEALSARLAKALAGGLAAYHSNRPPPAFDLRATYYAHLLRRPGEQDATAADELSPEEQEVLKAWAATFGITANATQGIVTLPLQLVCDTVAQAVGRSSDGSYRRRLANLLANFVRDVARYLNDPIRREAVRSQIAQEIAQYKPQVVIAHSLGSVVAYELLQSHDDLSVELLLTVGSPLALPGAIFDRLDPPPLPNAQQGFGTCPASVDSWINLADIGDLIAIPRPLYPRFRGLHPKNDRETHIGFVKNHGFGAYLRSTATANAVNAYLDRI